MIYMYHFITMMIHRYVKKLWDRYKDKDTTEMRTNAFNYIQQNHSSMRRMQAIIKIIKEL
jgi:hypothetical protein